MFNERHAHSVDHSSQLSIFDAIAAARLRDRGIELATGAKGKNALLTYAREGAREIALTRLSREVTADDVQAWLMSKGFEESALGNAAGAVFKQPELWEYVRAEKSKRTTAQARRISVWRFVGV
jgi:hypothetical protein